MSNNPKPILIVDDSPDIRESIKLIAESNGHSILEAANGREALARIRSSKEAPSMILLDLWMPEMNGLDFLDELESHGALSEIPVVVMTADPSSVSGHESVRAVLNKPFKMDALLRTFRAIL